MPSG
ncbi:hypothetical protein E2C01_065927 [Portunus trituberculatus]|jgi:hypothetical protein